MLQSENKNSGQELSNEGITQMLALAERLRSVNNGRIDDAAIQAMSEATGAPMDYVRLAVNLMPEKRKGVLQEMSTAIQSLEPDVRRHVLSGMFGTFVGLLATVGNRFGDDKGFFGVISLLCMGLAAWNFSISKDGKVATITGAIFGGVALVAQSLFSLIFHAPNTIQSWLLVPYVVVGALSALVLNLLVTRNRNKLGLKDPQEERQELLRQLVTLQDRLRSGEQSITFVCVDIVGSTKIKAQADPLSVEFTFTEYHKFVEMITKRYGGRIHSTAGDGVTCAFEQPQQGFGAARTIQAGLVELNTFRNKTGIPISLRAAVHSGSVVAPKPGDVTSLSFAHVIDIASHLQRACPPGGIAVSLESAQLMPGGPNAIGTERVSAQDVEAVVWEPKPLAFSLPAPVSPPTVPVD